MEIKIEIGQYRKVDKGSLRAFFTLIEHPSGRKTIDCRHFVQGDKHWFSFPQKEVKKDGQKSDYIPIVSYLNKEHLTQLKAAVEAALVPYLEGSNESKPQETNPYPF